MKDFIRLNFLKAFFTAIFFIGCYPSFCQAKTKPVQLSKEEIQKKVLQISTGTIRDFGDLNSDLGQTDFAELVSELESLYKQFPDHKFVRYIARKLCLARKCDEESIEIIKNAIEKLEDVFDQDLESSIDPVAKAVVLFCRKLKRTFCYFSLEDFICNEGGSFTWFAKKHIWEAAVVTTVICSFLAGYYLGKGNREIIKAGGSAFEKQREARKKQLREMVGNNLRYQAFSLHCDSQRKDRCGCHATKNAKFLHKLSREAIKTGKVDSSPFIGLGPKIETKLAKKSKELKKEAEELKKKLGIEEKDCKSLNDIFLKIKNAESKLKEIEPLTERIKTRDKILLALTAEGDEDKTALNVKLESLEGTIKRGMKTFFSDFDLKDLNDPEKKNLHLKKLAEQTQKANAEVEKAKGEILSKLKTSSFDQVRADFYDYQDFVDLIDKIDNCKEFTFDELSRLGFKPVNSFWLNQRLNDSAYRALVLGSPLEDIVNKEGGSQFNYQVVKDYKEGNGGLVFVFQPPGSLRHFLCCRVDRFEGKDGKPEYVLTVLDSLYPKGGRSLDQESTDSIIALAMAVEKMELPLTAYFPSSNSDAYLPTKATPEYGANPNGYVQTELSNLLVLEDELFVAFFEGASKEGFLKLFSIITPNAKALLLQKIARNQSLSDQLKDILPTEDEIKAHIAQQPKKT